MPSYVTFPVLRRKPMTWQADAYDLAAHPVEVDRVNVRLPEGADNSIVASLQDSLSKMALQESLLNTKKIQAMLQAQADMLAQEKKIDQQLKADLLSYEFTAPWGNPFKDGGIYGESQVPRNRRNFTREQVVAAMEEVVAARGPGYVDKTAKTTTASGLDLSDRCIQGDLMEHLGIPDSEKPGSFRGVADILGVIDDQPLVAALSRAQANNDREQTWGYILVEFKKDLGLAA